MLNEEIEKLKLEIKKLQEQIQQLLANSGSQV